MIHRPPLAPATWPELDELLGELRLADAELAHEAAEFDMQLKLLQDAKAAACEPARKRRLQLVGLILGFVEEHRAELPEKKRSVELRNGTVGIRTNPERVVYGRGSEYSIEVLRILKPDVITTTETLTAAQVKALDPVLLRQASITIAQDEQAYAKPKETPLPDYPAAVAALRAA